jgi:hypothetical protein
MSGTQETRKWKTTATGRIFYTIDRFPTHRAHVPNNGQSTKFIAGCNSSPQWCFGRNVPFPGVESSEGTGIVQPSYGLSAGGTFYQYPAWYLDAQQYGNWVYWLTPSTVSASFTGSYDAIGLGGTYGAMTTRQEWVIHKLRENYDPLPLPRFLTEVELRGLVTDRQDPHPYYLANLHHPTLSGNPTWFQDLLNIPNLTQDQIGLISDLKSWAEAGATLLDNSNRPAKWHLFWYYFKENSQSKLYTHPDSPHDAWGLFYNFPSYHAYRFAGLFTYVREAVKDALNATLQALQALPQNPGPGALRLGDMLYVRVPFTTTEYPSVGADETLRTIWFSGWTVQPNTPNVIPRRLAPPGSRNPMLMRMRRSTEESHAVYLMNCGIASDLDGAVLPEWSPDLYRAGIRNWAEGTLYLLPMTETELGPSAPHYDFTFSPNPSCP